MLEVVFCPGAEFSLQRAQRYGSGTYPQEAIGVCIACADGTATAPDALAKAQQQFEERERSRWKNAVALGGKPEDVLCFGTPWSIGDISGDCLSQARVDDLTQRFSGLPEVLSGYLEAIEKSRKNLETLLRRAAEGESVRIWYSEMPDEFCGMCWLISQLKHRLTVLPPIFVIKRPNQMRQKDVICRYQGWGEVCAHEFHTFLPLQQEVIPAFVTAAILKWQELQAQNAPLRATVNGSLMSVPENFYDFLLEQELVNTDDPFYEDHFLGGIIGKYPLWTNYIWIKLRCEEMVQQGILTPIPVPEAENAVRGRLLKKNKKLL